MLKKHTKNVLLILSGLVLAGCMTASTQTTIPVAELDIDPFSFQPGYNCSIAQLIIAKEPKLAHLGDILCDFTGT